MPVKGHYQNYLYDSFLGSGLERRFLLYGRVIVDVVEIIVVVEDRLNLLSIAAIVLLLFGLDCGGVVVLCSCCCCCGGGGGGGGVVVVLVLNVGGCGLNEKVATLIKRSKRNSMHCHLSETILG